MEYDNERKVFIDCEFRRFIPSALLRLGYIYPELNLSFSGNHIIITGDFSKYKIREIYRDVRHQIYREKIFQDTLDMRKNLYKMLAGQ